MKTFIFRAMALGLLSTLVSIGPVAYGGSRTCPAFTAGMVDASALLMFLDPDEVVVAIVRDNPADASIACELSSTETDRTFSVGVGDGLGCTGLEKRAFILVQEVNNGPFVIHAVSPNCIPAGQAHACRAEVLQSFVWNQYCESGLQ